VLLQNNRTSDTLFLNNAQMQLSSFFSDKMENGKKKKKKKGKKLRWVFAFWCAKIKTDFLSLVISLVITLEL
jgi:hypothetical protein